MTGNPAGGPARHPQRSLRLPLTQEEWDRALDLARHRDGHAGLAPLIAEMLRAYADGPPPDWELGVEVTRGDGARVVMGPGSMSEIRPVLRSNPTAALVRREVRRSRWAPAPDGMREDRT